LEFVATAQIYAERRSIRKAGKRTHPEAMKPALSL
jgi:hypothetical protein